MLSSPWTFFSTSQKDEEIIADSLAKILNVATETLREKCTKYTCLNCLDILRSSSITKAVATALTHTPIIQSTRGLKFNVKYPAVVDLLRLSIRTCVPRSSVTKFVSIESIASRLLHAETQCQSSSLSSMLQATSSAQYSPINVSLPIIVSYCITSP